MSYKIYDRIEKKYYTDNFDEPFSKIIKPRKYDRFLYAKWALDQLKSNCNLKRFDNDHQGDICLNYKKMLNNDYIIVCGNWDKIQLYVFNKLCNSLKKTSKLILKFSNYLVIGEKEKDYKKYHKELKQYISAKEAEEKEDDSIIEYKIENETTSNIETNSDEDTEGMVFKR